MVTCVRVICLFAWHWDIAVKTPKEVVEVLRKCCGVSALEPWRAWLRERIGSSWKLYSYDKHSERSAFGLIPVHTVPVRSRGTRTCTQIRPDRTLNEVHNYKSR